ncbi:ras-related protein Ral-A-like [Haliotis cracherodii]|uniref:ras-related protein Ral-A-like n=1 Tax=Haliotis cracherodii TaxID=6455 RepID=UPI0039E9FF30
MSDQYLSVVPQSGTTTNTHSRSSSFRNRPRPKLSLKIDSRPRSDSVPQIYLSVADSDNDIRTENAYDDSNSAHQGGGLCRVRSFKKTSKGVLNVGDKFKSKSTNSLKSGGSFINLHETDKKPSRTTSMTSMDSGASSAPSFFRVMVLGSDGVGKSTLIRQFMTSENLGPYEPRTPIGEPETTVSVLLDEEESVLEFVDNALMGDIDTVKPDCFLVVFSLTDITTFEMAKNLVRHIRTDLGNNCAIIMVANKTDLVRRRHISERDAISIACKYDCKYVEISIALNHRVDDLIVGILTQIRLRLRPDRDKTLDKRRNKMSRPKKIMTNLFSKLFKIGHASETQRCEDLFS